VQLWPITRSAHYKIEPKGSEYLFVRVLIIIFVVATVSLMGEVPVIILGLFTYVTELVLTMGESCGYIELEPGIKVF
jgi:hypothetical protein